MKNRLFTRSSLDFSAGRFDRPFNLEGKQYLVYCAKLDAELLGLEHRANADLVLDLKANVAAASDDELSRTESLTRDSPSFDAAGFEKGYEIDVRWI